MSSGQRAAHLITSPRDVLRDFSSPLRGSVYSAGYQPYLWAHGAGRSPTLQIQAKGWGYGVGGGVEAEEV